MAQIVRFHELGGPEVLRLEEVDVGEPGPGEVKLAIEAVGLNRAEAAMRGGHYIMAPALPSRLGSEAAGRVLAVGPGVTAWKAGDLVSTLPTQNTARYGTYATETLYPADQLIHRPAGLDAVQSAASWVAFLTAWGGLAEQARVAPGQPVVITAASSSVGLAVVQVARDAGATVLATTRTSAKAEAIRAAGASAMIATDEVDVVEEILRLTDGRGAPLIFDPVAGPFAERLMAGLADEGMLMVYGGMSKQDAVFPRQLAIRKNLTMRGFNFHPMLVDPVRRERALQAVAEKLASGAFAMPVALRFPLDRVADAHRAMEQNEHIGKIVLTVAP